MNSGQLTAPGIDDNTSTVVVKCPGCGKRNAIASSATTHSCPRCGCELATLAGLMVLAAARCASAASALRAGDHQTAADLALKSWELKQSRAAASVGLLATAAMGEFEAAASWARSRAIFDA